MAKNRIDKVNHWGLALLQDLTKKATEAKIEDF